MYLLVCMHSWNIGPVHLISFSTEVYFYLEQGIHLVKWQYEWLENDLKVLIAMCTMYTSFPYPNIIPCFPCSVGDFTRAACQAPLDHHNGTQTNVLLQSRWGHLQLEGKPSESVIRMLIGSKESGIQSHCHVLCTVVKYRARVLVTVFEHDYFIVALGWTGETVIFHHHTVPDVDVT